MTRTLENAIALAVVIAVPTALLWLLAMAYGALQEASWWRGWSYDAAAWLWGVAVLGGTALVLYLIGALLRLAAEWPPRWRRWPGPPKRPT